MTAMTTERNVERIYHAWDDALGRKDVESATALYAGNCILESPLVCHLLESDRGIVEGREKLREFLHIVFARTPPARQRYRERFFTDGRRLIWEYPRATPSGEQMDFVESMEIDDNGLICRHCVYWGWFGVRLLQRNEYHR
jgi:SnoaL-like domain